MDKHETTFDRPELPSLPNIADSAPRRNEPVILDSPHYYHLARVGLALYVEELKALAKKNHSEGRPREARTILEDAKAIEERIVPQLAAQRELAWRTDEQVEKAIGDALQVYIFRAFEGFGEPNKKMSVDAFERRRNRLLKELTQRVRMYAHDLAQSAWDAGYQARMTTPDSIAYDNVQSLVSAQAD